MNRFLYVTKAAVAAIILSATTAWGVFTTDDFVRMVDEKGTLNLSRRLQALEDQRAFWDAIPELAPHVKALFLSYNQITAIPESMGNLTNLQRLYLNDNQITVIPQSMGNLTHLQSLALIGNRITAIPEFIGNLTKLKWLSLRGNQITHISIGAAGVGGYVYGLDNHPLSLFEKFRTLFRDNPELLPYLRKEQAQIIAAVNQLLPMPEEAYAL